MLKAPITAEDLCGSHSLEGHAGTCERGKRHGTKAWNTE